LNLGGPSRRLSVAGPMRVPANHKQPDLPPQVQAQGQGQGQGHIEQDKGLSADAQVKHHHFSENGSIATSNVVPPNTG